MRAGRGILAPFDDQVEAVEERFEFLGEQQRFELIEERFQTK